MEQKVKKVSAMKRCLALITTLSLHVSVTVAWAAGAEYFVAGDGRMMVEARWPNCSWEENWQAGATWMNDGLPVPATPAAAADLARHVRPASIQMGKTERQYEDQ